VILSPFERDGVRAADMRKPYRTRHPRGSGNPRVLKDEGSCAMALPLTWIWDIRQFYAASGSAVGGTSRPRSGGCDRREVGRGDRCIPECLPRAPSGTAPTPVQPGLDEKVEPGVAETRAGGSPGEAPSGADSGRMMTLALPLGRGNDTLTQGPSNPGTRQRE
jgi:hypothetical protein